MKALLLATALTFGPFSLAQSQAIETGELGSAQAYEPGALTPGNGALGQNLWTGTSAQTAVSLMAQLPKNYSREPARALVRSALLSAGVPPHENHSGEFAKARLDAVIKLSEMAAAQDIARRTPALASSRELQADMALLSGDLMSACNVSDSIVTERSQPYWMKLRAFCHVDRGETAAAELTLDLLRSSGSNDKEFETLMRQLTGVPGRPDLKTLSQDPLTIAMMRKAALDWPAGTRPSVAAAQIAFSPVASPDERLSALFSAAHALSDTQISQIMRDLDRANSSDSGELAGGTPQPEPTLQSALEDQSAAGFSQLFFYAEMGARDDQIKALIALLKRAEAAGAFGRFVKYFEPQLAALSYFDLPREDISLISRAAILRGDLSALQQIHGLLGDIPEAQDRIALAADALGNGFYAGSLGIDIDTRLSKPKSKARALRDSLLAHALGANLSETALDVLSEKAVIGRLSGDLLALSAASRNRSQAEVALRSALLMEASGDNSINDLTFYSLVDALYQAGLTAHAAKIAALDFISDLPD